MPVGLCLLCRSWLGQRGPLGDGICRDAAARGLHPRPGVGVLSPEELSARVGLRRCWSWPVWPARNSSLPTHPMAIKNK